MNPNEKFENSEGTICRSSDCAIPRPEGNEEMIKEVKPTVAFADSFERLDIRVGRIIEVELETRTHKPTYKMVIDFGEFGKRVSYGRFTKHPIEDVKDRLVLGVLNFEPRPMGPVISEALILGVQYPKAESGEATFVSPAVNAEVGAKLF
jgi:tRNA-binding protein